MISPLITCLGTYTTLLIGTPRRYRQSEDRRLPVTTRSDIFNYKDK